MFSLAYDGQVFKFNFKYSTVDFLFEDEPEPRRITECFFSRKEEVNGAPVEKILASSLAICNSVDNFSKRMGRKVALAKLLKDMESDRDFRVAVWDEYFKHTKRAVDENNS